MREEENELDEEASTVRAEMERLKEVKHMDIGLSGCSITTVPHSKCRTLLQMLYSKFGTSINLEE